MSLGYEETIAADRLEMESRPLTEQERASLWATFVAIERAWAFGDLAAAMKPQWLDLVDALIASSPSYLGELVNAASVGDELRQAHPERWIEVLFFETVVTEAAEATTRLGHAKFYVVNQFVRAFVMLGGFTSFGGRNYGGYMGGSRFVSLPPVRVRGRR